MQHFFHSSSPTGCHYFEVKKEEEGQGQGQDITRSRSSKHRLILPLDKGRQARDLENRQEEEMTKFLKEFDSIGEVIQAAVHRTEDTAWLQKTGWREHLRDLEWQDVVRARRLPDEETEPELTVMCRAFDLLFGQCTRSVKAISGTLAAKYLVSFEPGKIRMKEFRLPEDTEKTLNTYTRLWKQCICYIYRVKDPACLGREMFKLKNDQSKAMKELWDQAKIVVDVIERGGKQAEHEKESWDKLCFCCLQFSITLLMHKLPLNLHENAIVSYTSSLGLADHTGPWQIAHLYRPKLSGIIYCTQLLFLEHHIRKQYGEDFTQVIANTVQEWMTHISSSPIEWLNELRAYAYIISQNTQMEPNITWDDNHQSVTYRNVRVSMDEFWGLIKE